MKIVLNGPVAQAGAAIVRHQFGAAAEVAEVDHRAADERAIEAFAEAEILVSVDFDRSLPPTPRLRLLHVPAAGLDTVDLAAVPGGCRPATFSSTRSGSANTSWPRCSTSPSAS